MKIATTLAVMFRKSPKAEIIMIYTYGANRRWMILPIKREHSHSMTQNIPGKQVLVRMRDCGKTTNNNIIQANGIMTFEDDLRLGDLLHCARQQYL